MLAALPVVLFASVGSADLAGLGLPAARAAALSAFAASSGMPRSGVLSRAAQLEFGVGAGVLSDEEARAIVVEQPEFLRCGFGLALETEQLVVVEKPFDTLLTPDKAGPRWAGELSLREWLRREHPSTRTEAGDEVRLCHNLDFATSGLLVAAKSRAAANDVASCFRERTVRRRGGAKQPHAPPTSPTQSVAASLRRPIATRHRRRASSTSLSSSATPRGTHTRGRIASSRRNAGSNRGSQRRGRRRTPTRPSRRAACCASASTRGARPRCCGCRRAPTVATP